LLPSRDVTVLRLVQGFRSIAAVLCFMPCLCASLDHGFRPSKGKIYVNPSFCLGLSILGPCV
jgi:hypothetical protein